MAKKTAKKKAAKGVGEGLRLEWIEAGSLGANPRNWRRHPRRQMEALKGVLGDGDVGWAGALLYNERTERLIDGHARKDAVSPGTPVPVLVGSWSEAAEAKILASHDTLTAMAEVDPAALDALMAEVDFSGEEMAGLAGELDQMLADAEGGLEEAGGRESAGAGGEGEDGGIASSFQVVAECEGEGEQQEVYELLKQHKIKCRVVTLY